MSPKQALMYNCIPKDICWYLSKEINSLLDRCKYLIDAWHNHSFPSSTDWRVSSNFRHSLCIMFSWQFLHFFNFGEYQCAFWVVSSVFSLSFNCSSLEPIQMGVISLCKLLHYQFTFITLFHTFLHYAANYSPLFASK